MSRSTGISPEINQSKSKSSRIGFKGCWLTILVAAVLLSWVWQAITLKVKNFFTLSAEIEGEELNEFMNYLGSMEINVNITDKEVEKYHEDGYILIRNLYNSPAIEAMRFIVDFVNKNPSPFYNLYKTPGRRFCGFFINPFFLIPAWRQVVKKSLERGMSTTASKLLLSNEPPIEVDSVLHSTPPECFTRSGQIKVRGNTHSDANQAVYSIERKRNIGDNMLVSWTALDRLDKETISFELWPKSHKWQEDLYGPIFNESNYCKIYSEMMNKTFNGAAHPTIPSVALTLNPGDVLFLQGFTFHRVIKSATCGVETCRRITTRYVRGEDTGWRDDVLKSMTWPYYTEIPFTDGLLVKDTKGMLDLSGKKFREEEISKPPIIPGLISWLKFFLDIKLSGGIKPKDIVNLCPEDMVGMKSLQA